MGFLDSAKDKLTEAVDQHGDTIANGIDKAGEMVDNKTGGKYTEQIHSGVGTARDTLDGLDGRNDDISSDTGPRDSTLPGEPPSGAPTDPAAPPSDPSVEPSGPGPEPIDPSTQPDTPSDPGLPSDPGNPATGEAPVRP